MDDQIILSLKRDGKSLREIARVLGVSHTTVMRRLKEMEQDHRMGVTANVADKDKCNIPSKPLPAKVSEESTDVDHPKAPPHRADVCVTGRGSPVKAPITGQAKGVSRESPGFEDLFEAIREFLQGIEVDLYRIQVTPEAYQVRHNDQTIHIYVQRKLEYPVVPQGGRRKRDINGR